MNTVEYISLAGIFWTKNFPRISKGILAWFLEILWNFGIGRKFAEFVGDFWIFTNFTTIHILEISWEFLTARYGSEFFSRIFFIFEEVQGISIAMWEEDSRTHFFIDQSDAERLFQDQYDWVCLLCKLM